MNDHDRFERIHGWVVLVIESAERLLGPRPLLVLIVVSVLIWGLVTQQPWAIDGPPLVPELVRVLTDAEGPAP